MRYKITSKIISLFLAILFVLPLCLFSVSAADSVPTFEDINETDVVSDLKRIGIDITKYQKDIEADYCRILYFLEYGYDYHNVSDDYGLYIYVWNPSGKGINCVSGQNSIELQISPTSNVDRDGLGFSKHKLELCNYSTIQGYECVFYKFKVHVSSSFRSFLNRDLRTYDISGIELQHSGDSKPTDYAVGGVYSFDGYMPYHGKTSSETNTLNTSVIDRLVIELEMTPVSWKSQTSDKGIGYAYEMFSVYFSIPNGIIRDYGNPANEEHKGLVQIDGQYSKHKINGIATNDNLLEAVKPYLGKKITYDFSVPLSFYTKRESILSSDLQTSTFYYIDPFNIKMTGYGGNELGTETYRKAIIPYLSSVVEYSGDDLVYISQSDILADLNSCWSDTGVICFCDVCKSAYGPYQDIGYGTDVQYSIKAGEDLAEQIATFASQNKETLLGWLTGTNKLIIENETYEGAKSIQAVSASDLSLKSASKIAEDYFMYENEASDFKSFVNSENLKGKTSYILRLGVDDYYCREATVNLNGSTYNDGEYYFEKTIFQNIDVFSFTFENEYSQRTVIPVVATPVDNVGTITPSLTDKLEDDALNDIKRFLALFLGFFVFFGLIFLFSKIFGVSVVDVIRFIANGIYEASRWIYMQIRKFVLWIRKQFKPSRKSSSNNRKK